MYNNVHTQSSQNTSKLKVYSITISGRHLQIWWKHYWAPHSVTLYHPSQSHSQLPTESSFLLQCHPSQFHLPPIALTLAVTLTLTSLNHSLLCLSFPAEPPSTASLRTLKASPPVLLMFFPFLTTVEAPPRLFVFLVCIYTYIVHL